MTDPNIHIKEFITYYLEIQHAPGYAILLKGQWGSGKTWLIKDIFKTENSEEKKELYISLYGLSSFEDIEDQIFKQLHPVLSSKTLSVASKIAKGLLKTTLKIDLDSEGKGSTIVQSQIPDIDIPNFLKNTEGKVFIFDDLERSSINLNSLLGYINHFVEHQECKVIIIANESEIVSSSSKENKKEFENDYLRIKEKLIGREFTVTPNSNDAIKSFISEIKNNKINIFLENQTNNIININNRSEYNNLRSIRNALFEFERFSMKLETEYLNSNEFMEDILMTFLILFIEIRSGEINNENFDSIFRYNKIIPLGKEPRNTTEKIECSLSEKYTSFDLLIDKDIWSSFLFNGYADKEKLNKSISYTRYFNKKNKPNWVKLWGINELTESEFQEILPLVEDEFHQKKYSEIGEVKHVFGILLGLCEDGLSDSNKDGLLDFTKKYLSQLIKSQSTETLQEVDPYLDSRSWEGFGFHKVDSNEFKEINTFIENEKLQNYKDCKPKIARDLINLITTDPDLFLRKIILNNHKDNLYYKEDILSYSDENIFCDKVISLPPKKRSTIFYALNVRYLHDNLNQELISELPWLEKIINILNEKTTKKNITSLQIKLLMDHYLLPARNKLLESNR